MESSERGGNVQATGAEKDIGHYMAIDTADLLDKPMFFWTDSQFYDAEYMLILNDYS